MKWFKHDSDASIDAKLRRVRVKYGMEGYGLYWYCLELIARNVEKHNLTFELEHDAELISCDVNIHQERVEEMMVDFVKWDLFESDNGVITCLQMATRTDEYTHKLIRTLENVPTISRQSRDKVPPKRREEKRIEEKKKFPPSLEDVKEYCQERNNSVNPENFIDHYETNGWFRGKTKIKDWKACVRTWEKNSKPKDDYGAGGV